MYDAYPNRQSLDDKIEHVVLVDDGYEFPASAFWYLTSSIELPANRDEETQKRKSTRWESYDGYLAATWVNTRKLMKTPKEGAADEDLKAVEDWNALEARNAFPRRRFYSAQAIAEATSKSDRDTSPWTLVDVRHGDEARDDRSCEAFCVQRKLWSIDTSAIATDAAAWSDNDRLYAEWLYSLVEGELSRLGEALSAPIRSSLAAPKTTRLGRLIEYVVQLRAYADAARPQSAEQGEGSPPETLKLDWLAFELEVHVLWILTTLAPNPQGDEPPPPAGQSLHGLLVDRQRRLVEERRAMKRATPETEASAEDGDAKDDSAEASEGTEPEEVDPQESDSRSEDESDPASDSESVGEHLGRLAEMVERANELPTGKSGDRPDRLSAITRRLELVFAAAATTSETAVAVALWEARKLRAADSETTVVPRVTVPESFEGLDWDPREGREADRLVEHARDWGLALTILQLERLLGSRGDRISTRDHSGLYVLSSYSTQSLDLTGVDLLSVVHPDWHLRNELNSTAGRGLRRPWARVKVRPKTPASLTEVRTAIRESRLATKEALLEAEPVGSSNGSGEGLGAEQDGGSYDLHFLITGAGFELHGVTSGEKALNEELVPVDRHFVGVASTGKLLDTMVEWVNDWYPPDDPRRAEFRKRRGSDFPIPVRLSPASLEKGLVDAAASGDLDHYFDLLFENIRQHSEVAVYDDSLKTNAANQNIQHQELRFRHAFRRAALGYDDGYLEQALAAAHIDFDAWLTTNYTHFADRAIEMVASHRYVRSKDSSSADPDGPAADGDTNGAEPPPHQPRRWEVVSNSVESTLLQRKLQLPFPKPADGDSTDGKKPEAANSDEELGSRDPREIFDRRYLIKLHGDIGQVHTMAVAGQDKYPASILAAKPEVHELYAMASTLLVELVGHAPARRSDRQGPNGGDADAKSGEVKGPGDSVDSVGENSKGADVDRRESESAPRESVCVWHVVGHRLEDRVLMVTIERVLKSLGKNVRHRFVVVDPFDPMRVAKKINEQLEAKEIPKHAGEIEFVLIGGNAKQYMTRLVRDGRSSVLSLDTVVLEDSEDAKAASV